MKKTLFFVMAALALAAASAYKIATRIKIGGEGRWDDLYVNSERHQPRITLNRG